LAKSHVHVAVDLFQAPSELFDSVYRVFDPPGEFSDLTLKSVHAQFAVDRSAGTSEVWGAARAAHYLPLQHAEVSFQPIETLLRPSILRSRRLGRYSKSEDHQQQGWTSMRQRRALEHSMAS
jgi:hypothetical protein